MRFLIRHPVALVFLAAFLVLSFAVFNKYQAREVFSGPGGPGGPGGSGGNNVAVHAAGMQVFQDQVESLGTAHANESVNLTAKVTDTVSNINFVDGQYVEAGTVLVELTKGEQAAQLREAQTSAEEARRQFERLLNLVENNLISETELDGARARADTAQARLEAVIARMDDRLIRAPFSGILGFRNISEGTLLSPSTVITTLDDTSVIKVDFTVPEVYLAELHAGQEISARSVSYPDLEFTGEVRTIGSRIDPATRSVSVRAHVDNSQRLLRPGMLMTVLVTLEATQILAIPEQALVPRQGRQYVFVVDEETNRVQEVEVTIGRRQPGIAEIVSGLRAGQLVVTEGMSQLRPGQEVVITRRTENDYLSPGGERMRNENLQINS